MTSLLLYVAVLPSGAVGKSTSLLMFVCSNVVSTIKLGCSLDLLHIGRRARNTEYRPKVQRPGSRLQTPNPRPETRDQQVFSKQPGVFQVFQALTMRIRKPPTTAQFYKSGSMVCLGAKRSVCLDRPETRDQRPESPSVTVDPP